MLGADIRSNHQTAYITCYPFDEKIFFIYDHNKIVSNEKNKLTAKSKSERKDQITCSSPHQSLEPTLQHN